MVGSNLSWPAPRIARLGFEFIFLPFRLPAHGFLFRAFNRDFVTSLGDASEGSIRVHQVIGIEAGVHDLPARKHVVHGPVAQDDDHSAERHNHPFISRRRRETVGSWYPENGAELR